MVEKNPFVPGTWEWAAYVAATDLSVKPYGVDESYEEAFDNENWGYIFCTAWYEHDSASSLGPISLVRFLAGKQHDYGPLNITKFGPAGLKVRLWDKIARIQNLRGRGTTEGVNESLNDSFVDLMGYCVIMKMLQDGTFEYPLECDLPKPEEASGVSDYQRGQIPESNPLPTYRIIPHDGESVPQAFVAQAVGVTEDGNVAIVFLAAEKVQ